MNISKKDIHTVSPEIIIQFFTKVMPFSDLNTSVLEELSSRCLIDFYPKDTLIFRQDETEVNYLYLIQKGGVKIYLKNESGEVILKDFRGEGSYIGALPIIQGTKANLNVETVEDTFCFLLPKDIFLKLIHTNPQVANYYLKSMSEKLIRTAYAELRHNKMMPRSEGTLYLFSVQVGDIIKKKPEVISPNDTVQQAAVRMAELHIGSLLVTDERGEVMGIVTDKDLRTKVVAAGLPYDTHVAAIMTAPIYEIQAHEICFNALIAMMSQRIHHLVVKRKNELAGVITAHDIMVLQGSSPLYLFREIMAQTRIEGLYPLAKQMPSVIRNLIEEGAKANNITRMITILNDHLLDRLLTLLQEEMGPAPISFCWLSMGSEGRKEQTFHTDQDNAILYADSKNAEQAQAAQAYFKAFTRKAIDHLVACGYPPCPGNIMATNPKWCVSLNAWQNYFSRWISEPNPQEILNATIFFDFRPTYGHTELGKTLWEYLIEQCKKNTAFLYFLAQDCVSSPPPLSFFRNFIVEKDGEHKNQLDIKKRGIAPFVDFARLLSLKNGIKETNTLARMQLLYEGGHLSRELYTEMRDAYDFLMQLRLVHQLQLLEQGMTPDNYIDPASLSELEKQTLKEAFGVIGRMHGVLKNLFRVS
ncbi:MAG: DUF294 nucleotidyltransferase-like domain-containing protein [Dissulfuribacterales bacterium]